MKSLFESLRRYLRVRDFKEAQTAWRQFRHANLSSVRKYGAVQEAFIQEHKEMWDKRFGKNGELIPKIDPVKGPTMLHQELDKALKTKTCQERMNAKGPRPLSDYSDWLTKYEKYAVETGEYIEIPGQYTGEQKPEPDFHIRIVNFDPQLLVMSSLRRPKCLTINGSDERAHRYLVKGMEDLRMDQRIEQGFMAMNAIMKLDAACSRRGLKIRTYQVVPLTASLGMLEWVDSE